MIPIYSIPGVEIFINDSEKIDIFYQDLENKSSFDQFVEKTNIKYIQVFEWLKLLDRNIIIFFSLILFVASFNMISILIILIMERTRMIGILKALGSNNNQIKNIFIKNGLKIILIGIIFGNIFSITIGLLQDNFKIFQLDKASYYMEYVPIAWDFIDIMELNLIVFVVIYIVMLVPILIINRINILDSIKFN